MPSPNQLRWEPIAREAARAAGIDECIFVALINQESTWDPRSVNGPCHGIAQINPAFHPVDPYDAKASLFYAARLIQSYRIEGGSYEKALGAYNWGAGNMRANGWAVPPHVQWNFVRPILNAAAGCVVEPVATPEETAIPAPSYITTFTPVPTHIATATPAPGMTATPTPQFPGILGLVLVVAFIVTRK